jgi:hypothetical protein
MTPPQSNESEGRKASPPKRLPPLWRLAFDIVERPVAAASESWVQTEVFMDALAMSWKLQKRLGREVHRGFGLWLDLWGLPRRSDLTTLVNQVASLERQVRQVTRELERERGSANGKAKIAAQRPAATTRRSSANGGGR